MKIVDRYASATRSGNLKSEPGTTFSDSDVVGAFGFAGATTRGKDSDNPWPGQPLAAALQRLFTGDNRASREIVAILAQGVVTRAWRTEQVKLAQVEAEDMARAVLGWFRHGTCIGCGGHGFKQMQGAPTLSDQECPACRGTGKLLFDRQFAMERVDLARWMLAEVEREQAKAGPAAMEALLPRLEL